VARRCGTAEGRANQQRSWRACGPARECGQKAQAEAHKKHQAHVRDAGGVKAQRLVESIRPLPSPKGASDGGKRVARRCGTEGRANQQHGCLAQLGSVGRRRRRKRTLNMPLMSVTLEVSKLSGWLKALAPCRVQRGHPMEGNACGTEMWHSRRKGESAAWVFGPARECGQKAQAEAHIEHAAHGCDAGGVKAQRLVESIRVLPSPKGTSVRGKRVAQRRCGGRCGPGGGAGGRASGSQPGRPDSRGFFWRSALGTSLPWS
jgi:hypothetical protein